MSLKLTNLEIPEILLFTTEVYDDSRGSFMEIFKFSEYKEKIGLDFLQDNISYSKKNVIRGLHFQKPPFEQGKLLTVASGAIMDVAVDIRPNSDYFMKHVSIELQAGAGNVIYVPPGFAHGFCSLEENTIVFYKNTNEYSRTHESGIIYNDSDLGIDWPVENPILSEKDLSLPNIKEAVSIVK